MIKKVLSNTNTWSNDFRKEKIEPEAPEMKLPSFPKLRTAGKIYVQSAWKSSHNMIK